MGILDFIFIAIYFLIVASIAYFSGRKSREDSNSYFLGGRRIIKKKKKRNLFASNISAEHIIGVAGSGATSCFAGGQFEWLACFSLLLLGW